ncbi:ABC-1 domain protein [Oscillochloris trichoides DG-6]|uniref:ABC-1 domain protein n=1 Tax=Oscillochloris trichoides DG-6 TaxID=765420 RepID=E1ID84_9CHLR|nr:AarF/UbiB family protein [Oscillochloris trichoides]EFO80863.1 ABC-1 domain protein [Oscillochloris trichoides DG-6]
MWPLVRQARYLGRYREIAQVLVGHGFGYVVEQLGLLSLLSIPRRVVMRVPPTPPLSSAERLREALIALGPTFVKLGQALSTRPDLLPAEFVHELGKLQDTVPPFPSHIAVATIEESLGKPINKLFASFELQPLAAASLGQVHAATLPTGELVVVKVQRPDIAGRIITDLAILADLAALAEERFALGSQYRFSELVRGFSITLRAELDYRREGRNADRFRQLFAAVPQVYIPTVYWAYTEERVLTSERLFGVKVNDLPALTAAGIDPVQLARGSMQVVLQEIFNFGFFHSDPHPGNFFALDGNRLGIVDFGQVGSLDRPTTQGLVLLLGALVEHDTHGLLRALEQLEVISRRAITPALRRDMAHFTEGFVDRPLSELSARETVSELLSLLRRHQIWVPGPLAMLLKALVMMEGMGAQLDPDLDVFSIARPYARQAMAEHFSPQALGQRALRESRLIGETALELPHQLSDLLQSLDDGDLKIQTRELELRHLSHAILSAANRLAIALVLVAMILGVGLVAVAMGVGGWQGTLPTILLTLGIAGVILSSFVLGIALLRGRE